MTNKTHGIYENWHYWKVQKGYLLSDEETKRITSHNDVNSIINYLYLTGFKDAARAINQQQRIITNDTK